MAEKPKKLPPTAYELKPGETYVPYVQGGNQPETTLKAVITGCILGMLFGFANTYLGLTAGLTISTSIPVAVLTVLVFKVLSIKGPKSGILEANMSQTIGSASSSVASGVLFTLPALFLWEMHPTQRQMTLLAMAGGIIGVLAMIPLRRYLIKKEHGNLPYPEGVACAEVLVASEQGGKQASGVFWGIGIGMLIKLVTGGLKLIGEKVSIALPFRAGIDVKVSPALIGVGYILGLRVSAIMVSGAALSSLILIPGIYLWARGMDTPLDPEPIMLVADMNAAQIWNRYIRYIGAGAVATAGIITLIQSIPSMIESFKVGLVQLTKSRKGAEEGRTDRDLAIKYVIWVLVIVLAGLILIPGILGFLDSVVARTVAAILIACFAFFFVTVSSRIVGMVGVTSNPTSGMTIATLLATSFIFYMLGYGDLEGIASLEAKATVLMVGTVVCIAASIAGDTSQDLKTGYLLGATPYRQQIGELIGVITSAGVVCWVLVLLDNSQELGSQDLPAPQATLMKLVIDGVLDQQLPWYLILIGVGISLVVFFMKIPPLPFAVGVYLPLSTMAPVFIGGLMRHFLAGKKVKNRETRQEQGILFGSGLVGGEGLMGVGFAIWVGLIAKAKITGFPIPTPDGTAGVIMNLVLSLIGLGILLWIFRWAVLRKPEGEKA